jgi:hypothetical protein
METPLRESAASSRSVSQVRKAHAIVWPAAPASYGYHMAAAAAESVRLPICSAKMDGANPLSAKTTAQVRPETPAPTMATRRFISKGDLFWPSS